MLGGIRGEVRFKEPLAFHTSLRCGGPADIFILPQDVDDVRKALGFADKEMRDWLSAAGLKPCAAIVMPPDTEGLTVSIWSAERPAAAKASAA